MDKKIEETREFLQTIGMPKAQQADICCYVILAMAGIKPDMSWSEATNEWIRIHDIIQFVNTFYGITKPFVIGALQRKIKAMFAMLEHHKPAKDIYDDGRLFLDFSEQTASLNGKPLTLSPMEYKMLNLFRKNPRQVLTRGQLLEKLWDIDERFVDEHTLTTSISRIRSKIESDGGAPYIKTVYGMGYQWTGGEAK